MKKQEVTDDGRELVSALEQLTKEKGIDKEIIYEAIEMALLSACKKNFGNNQHVKVGIDRETGVVEVYAQKTIVEEVTDPANEFPIEYARQIDPQYEIGDIVEEIITPKDFGRISAQTAKQVVVQKIREAERDILYNHYIDKDKSMVSGIIERIERRAVIISLGKLDAALPQNEQVPTERYNIHDRLKVYVSEVRKTSKGPQITVSRSHPELVKCLFRQESPEVSDGTVVIKAIAREAGYRTKMAVYSLNSNVDPIGACVGHNGYRVNTVVNELFGEKIDIVEWSENPARFIASALNPGRVIAIHINEDGKSARVVVPDNQLSLAIGKEGQNVRLAAKLTGWKIDIKNESAAKATDFVPSTAYLTTLAMLGEPYA